MAFPFPNGGKQQSKCNAFSRGSKFDFFKENESKLQERPSDQVWQKLEKKLETSRRKKRPGIRFLQLTTVALILLVLIFAGVMVWYFSRK